MPYPDESSAVPVLLRVKLPEASSLEYPTKRPGEPVMFGPNITGTAKGDEFPTQELVNLDGAFYKAGVSGDTYTGGGHGSAIIGFDASLVSSVYGGSSTVQPSSVALLACIKF